MRFNEPPKWIGNFLGILTIFMSYTISLKTCYFSKLHFPYFENIFVLLMVGQNFSHTSTKKFLSTSLGKYFHKERIWSLDTATLRAILLAARKLSWKTRPRNYFCEQRDKMWPHLAEDWISVNNTLWDGGLCNYQGNGCAVILIQSDLLCHFRSLLPR